MAREHTEHFSHLSHSSLENCLCLICRRIGHIAESCSLIPTNAGTERPFPPFDLASSACTQTQVLCQGCQQLVAGLNNLSDHRPLALYDDTWEYQLPPLGPAKSIQLLSSCPLCRLVFDITYLPSESLASLLHPSYSYEGEFSLIPAWTVHRLEKDLSWPGYETGKGPYAKCIFTLVTLKSRIQDSEFIDQALDAIGVVDDGQGSEKGGPALGVKEVDPLTPDYDMIKRWLRRCDELHLRTCRPLVSEDLQKIKLVDVETRQIVRYPPEGCDYIALSYVWGGVEQPNYNIGDVLPTVPATLEDAMEVTRILGKRYLWVDSLCIDQENDTEKAVQISLMSSVYTGAWATIFCLSGKSALSGLPRVGNLEGVIPQLRCEIGGKRWLSIMPTLSQQFAWSPWATRAWTFQEGLLSPRRLFFTNHQVYFECNSVQCCESLDDTNSPFHLASDEQRHVHLDERINAGFDLPTALGHGVFRDPFRPFRVSQVNDNPFRPPLDHKFRRYLQLLSTYTRRKLTQDTDSINAFSAIMTRFQESEYQKGFLHGIPVEEIPRALVWMHEASPRRRVGFPTWTWAGWEGPVRPFTNDNMTFTFFRDGIDMPPLRVWKPGDGGIVELIHDFSPVQRIMKKIDTLQGRPLAECEDNGQSSDESARDSKENSLEGDLEESVHEIINDIQSAVSTSCVPDSDCDDSGSDCLENNTDSLNKEYGDETDSANVLYDTPSVRVPFRLQWYEEWDENWMVNINKDPIFLLAKQMTVSRAVLPNLGHDELLIEGIVIRLTFSKTKDGDERDGDEIKDDDDGKAHEVGSERDPFSGNTATTGSDDASSAGHASDESIDFGRPCYVELEEGQEPLDLTFYGHDAKERIHERSGTEQHFLLLSRDRRDEELVMAALLHIDWESDLVASRVGVASIVVEGVGKWASLKPETKMFKLH